MDSHRYEIFADHHQFSLQDDDRSIGDLGGSWSDEAVARMLATEPGVVGIGTARNVEVPVVVEVHESEPAMDLSLWDHVAECALDVKTGRIVIAGPADFFPKAARIEVSPGVYRVRVAAGELDSVAEDGLTGADHYRVQLWKSDVVIGVQVHKQHRRREG